VPSGLRRKAVGVAVLGPAPGWPPLGARRTARRRGGSGRPSRVVTSTRTSRRRREPLPTPGSSSC